MKQLFKYIQYCSHRKVVEIFNFLLISRQIPFFPLYTRFSRSLHRIISPASDGIIPAKPKSHSTTKGFGEVTRKGYNEN